MSTRSAYRSLNLLFLLVLLLQLANAALMWMPQYVRLILNQALFVFLPAYLYLRRTGQPVRDRVRWRWPDGKTAVLSLLIGLGLYPVSAVSAGVLQQVLGYVHLPMPDDVLPTTALMGALAVIAYAVMAPLCEEFLFRGVIQPAYEQRGMGWGVGFVGFLFIVFHLSLLQGLSIIPLALVLGFVNARTRSLQAGILTHFGANLSAALVLTSGVFWAGAQELIFSAPMIIGGLIVALLALGVLAWLTRHSTPSPGQPLAAQPLALASGWPLYIATVLWLAVVGAEFVTARNPQIIAEPLQLQAVEWGEAPTWRYELQNPADEVVGEGACTVAQEGALVTVTCSSTVVAYEVRIGSSLWSSAGGRRDDRFVFRAGDGNLVEGSTSLNLRESEYRQDLAWTAEDDGIDLRIESTAEEDRSYHVAWDETPRQEQAELPLLTDYAAPWQLAGVRLESGEGGQTLRFTPYAWRQETQDSGPATHRWAVAVQGRETITTPAGVFDTRRVTFGPSHVVWFDDSTTPAIPIRFFNGMETWSLQ